MLRVTMNYKTLVFGFAVSLASVCIYRANGSQLFSTKTPYAWTHPSHESAIVQDELYHMTDLPGMSCSAVHASSVARHGARYPSAADIKEIISLHAKLRTAMKEQTMPEIFNWQSMFPKGADSNLSSLGEQEHEAFGRRTAKKLTTLFTGKNEKSFNIFITYKERTLKSAEAFKKGLVSVLNLTGSFVNDSIPVVDDELLRFYDLCAKYVNTVDKNKTAFSEIDKYQSSATVSQVRDSVQGKLGVNGSVLTTADVDLMYNMCGYEKGLNGTFSPWCLPFQDDQMPVLTYLEDMTQFYTNGYGYDITWQQSCPLLSEIFINMDRITSDLSRNPTGISQEQKDYLVAQLAFGHAETLGPLFSLLGLFKDPEPLRADNFEKLKNRAFNCSSILPFASNILFVLYQCVPETPSQKSQNSDFYLKMFVNEEATTIPGCQNMSCPYGQVRDRYQDSIDHCNFQQICQWPPPSGATSGTLAQTLVGVVLVGVSVFRAAAGWQF